MKVLFPVLVLCTAAVVAVVLAIHFRVKRHLREHHPAGPVSDVVAAREDKETEIPGVVEDGKEHGSS